MPIVMTKEEWAKITRWTEGSKEDPEAVRRRDYVRYLNEASQEMTKTWPNSLENVNKRNEELRRARIEAAEQANSKFYKRYVQRKQEEQKRLLHDARDTMFKNKDAPKMLLRAVIETVIQKERQEQIKFKQHLHSKAIEQKRKDDDDIIRKAKEWHELMDVRKQRRFDANKQHQKEIVDQAHEVSERNRTEYEMELNLQKIDNIKAREQMDAIKQFEEDFKAAEKARIWSDMKRSQEEANARRREQEARDALDKGLLEVLQRSRARTEARRRLTEKQIQEERLQVLQKISDALESGDAAREEDERKRLEKAIREKEAAAQARREADARKQEKFRQQRADTRRQFLQQEDQRLRDLDTMRQWELMNRFKNVEIYEAFQEKLRDDKKRKVQQYREDIIKQWHERDERETRARAEIRYFYGERAENELRAADEKLLTYGAALAQEACDHGRPPRPLYRAMDRYCKMYRLYPMPELPDTLQKHFPHYAPEDRSQAGGSEGGSTRRDGLTDVKAGPSTSKAPEMTEEDTADYVRKGPANGMQRPETGNEASLTSLAQRE